jgi:DNA-binding transcriptional regulator LsrR (DeoR family)
MSSKTRITAPIIERVWSLYETGWQELDIARHLKISNTSVQRCVLALNTAKSGKKVKYEGLLRDSHHIADYANERFRPGEVVNEDSKHAAAINRLADSIEKQTRLFESVIRKLER